MPSPGKITHLRTPSGGIGVRYDNGTYEGYEVPLEYDSLLSKLVTWGETREEAIQRMLRALSEYQVYGIKTTIPFFVRILHHAQFLSGNYNTHFIEALEKEKGGKKTEEEVVALITAGIKTYMENKLRSTSRGSRKISNWKFQGRLENLSRRL
jgi:acetyl-CoA carboxylase biotin carboxylase subunit